MKLGVWESALHLKDQLFVMILETKLVYVAVHKSRATASPYTNQKQFIDNFQFKDLTWQKQKKQLLRLFGSRNPFATQDGTKTDFFGVVTFELEFKDISGMECTSSLIDKLTRLVFEASLLKKRDFACLTDFFVFYDLMAETEYHYQPILNRKKGRIQIKTAWNTLNHMDEYKFDKTILKSYDYNLQTKQPN